MRTIISIDHIEERQKDDKTYYRTYATVDSGEECVGYGRDFKVGDLVEVFFDAAHNTVKIRLGITRQQKA